MGRNILVVLVLTIVAFVGVIVWLGISARSATESALASVLLTLISIAASWIVSHYYYLMATKAEIERVTSQHDESLKTYARKAAEKVTNLSKELDRLSTFLREYLKYDTTDESIDVLVGVRDERVTGAIHIVDMLRSVNDTSLSDWYGVIGEELEKKKEKEEKLEAERERILVEAVDKLDSIIDSRGLESKPDPSEARIISEIKNMRNEVAAIAAGLSVGSALRTSPLPPRRSRLYLPCPICRNDVEVKQGRGGQIKCKTYSCSACKSQLVVNLAADGNPIIELRRSMPEHVSCPSCSNQTVVALDNVLGASASLICSHCNQALTVSRSSRGIITAPVKSGQMMDQTFLESVRQLLPQQPWKKGIHAEIAATLNVSGASVQKAIQKLISDGVFKHQVNGVMFERLECPPSDTLTQATDTTNPDTLG